MVSYRRLAMRVLGHVPMSFGKKKASPPPRVAAQRIAALALACAMMTGMALPAFAGTYDIVNGSIDIHATKDGNLISSGTGMVRTKGIRQRQRWKTYRKSSGPRHHHH